MDLSGVLTWCVFLPFLLVIRNWIAEKPVLEKEKLRPPILGSVQILFDASELPEGPKKNRRSKMTSCPLWLPLLDLNQRPSD